MYLFIIISLAHIENFIKIKCFVLSITVFLVSKFYYSNIYLTTPRCFHAFLFSPFLYPTYLRIHICSVYPVDNIVYSCYFFLLPHLSFLIWILSLLIRMSSPFIFNVINDAVVVIYVWHFDIYFSFTFHF